MKDQYTLKRDNVVYTAFLAHTEPRDGPCWTFDAKTEAGNIGVRVPEELLVQWASDWANEQPGNATKRLPTGIRRRLGPGEGEEDADTIDVEAEPADG